MSEQPPPYPPHPAYPTPPPGYGPPPQPSASLPRRAVGPLTLALLPLLGLVVFAPIFLLAAGGGRLSASRIYMHFKDGGLGMWGITLSQMMLAAVFLALAIFMIRGKRVPGAILFMLALLPLAISVLGALASQRMIMDALSGESIDPSQKARIMAEGISELCNVTIYGGVAAGFAMYVAGVVAVLSLAAIDTAPLGPAPKSAAWILPMMVGPGAAILAGVTRGALHLSFTGLDVLVIFGLMTSGFLAALGGKPLPSLIAGRNEDEAGPAWRLLLLAASSFSAAMLCVDRASSAAALRTPLGAVAGETVDQSQRARILLEMIAPSLRGRPIVMVVDVLLCLAVFAAPLVAGLGAKRKASVAGFVAGGMAALVAGLVLLAGSRSDAAIADQRAPFVQAERSLAESGVAVPVARSDAGTMMLPGALDVLVKSDGSLVDKRAERADRDDQARSLNVAADGALPFEKLMSKVGSGLLAGRPGIEVGLLVTPAARIDFTPLGPFAGLMGTDLLVFPVALNTKLADKLPPKRSRYGGWSEPRSASAGKVLAVLPQGDTARLVVLFRSNLNEVDTSLTEVLPLGDTPRAEEDRRKLLSSIHKRRSGIETLLLAPAAGETVAQVTAQLEAIAGALPAPRDDLALTADRAALDQAASARQAGGLPAPSR